MQTLTRLFDTHDDAVAIVRALEAGGFRHEDISLVAADPDMLGPVTGETLEEDAASGAGTGATLGTMLGGGAGLLAGLGALAIPGLGPIVAAGWLVATLTGAGLGAAVAGGVGGMIGALTHEGVAEDDAHVFAEGVRRGGSLVTLRVEDSDVPHAERILDARTAVNPRARRAEYADAGWHSFDAAAPAYASPTLDAARPAPGVSVVPAASDIG